MGWGFSFQVVGMLRLRLGWYEKMAYSDGNKGNTGKFRDLRALQMYSLPLLITKTPYISRPLP
jgi:hypothetical protein